MEKINYDGLILRRDEFVRDMLYFETDDYDGLVQIGTRNWDKAVRDNCRDFLHCVLT